jgi:hypothetical protein
MSKVEYKKTTGWKNVGNAHRREPTGPPSIDGELDEGNVRRLLCSTDARTEDLIA